MRAWWAVCAFTLVMFLVNFLSVFWTWEAPHHLLLLGNGPQQEKVLADPNG